MAAATRNENQVGGRVYCVVIDGTFGGHPHPPAGRWPLKRQKCSESATVDVARILNPPSVSGETDKDADQGRDQRRPLPQPPRRAARAEGGDRERERGNPESARNGAGRRSLRRRLCRAERARVFEDQ